MWCPSEPNLTLPPFPGAGFWSGHHRFPHHGGNRLPSGFPPARFPLLQCEPPLSAALSCQGSLPCTGGEAGSCLCWAGIPGALGGAADLTGNPSCPQMEPTCRPSFLEITQCLEGILQHQPGADGTGATLFGGGETLPVPGTAATLNGTWVPRGQAVVGVRGGGMWGVPSYPGSCRGRKRGLREVFRMEPVAVASLGCAPGLLGAWHPVAPRGSGQLVTRSRARAQG